MRTRAAAGSIMRTPRFGIAGTALLVVLAPWAVARGQDAGGRAKAAYDRAVALEGQGNPAAALSLLWEAAGLAPHDADIQNRLGEALERIGALDAAIDAFRSALAARPQFQKAANNLILALVKAGKGPEAVERARARAAAAAGDPDAYFTLGLAQSEQDVEGAAASFRRALELDPRHTLARYNLALVLQRTDRLKEAHAELERGLAIDPRPELYYTEGIVYWHEGRLDRAAASLRSAVDRQPAYFEAWHSLGTVLNAAQDRAGATAALRKAVALRPDQPAPRYALAQVLQRTGHDAEARAQRDTADRLRERARIEQEAGVWTASGTQQLDAGDAAAAVEHFRRAIALLDSYAPAHYQMGRALDRLGQRDAARAAFTRAHELNPSLVPPRDPR
jgi:tetratricopeptide (TPR) repeat protein